MRNYINKYALSSISHKEFRQVFEDTVSDIYGQNAAEIFNQIDWDSWIYTTGYPIKNIEFNSKLADEAIQLAEEFLNNHISENAKQRFDQFDTNVKSVFLAYLKENINKINDECYTKLRD